MAARLTLTAAPLLLCLLALAGCSSPAPKAEPTSYPALPSPDHIVVILEENKPSDKVLSDDDAPYLNQLASKYAVAHDYSAITHPSLPNYIALTSGSTAGISSDCLPSECGRLDVSNLADSVDSAGLSWRIYGEGMPEPCGSANSGNYAVKHIPFLYYKSVVSDPASCRDHIVPYPQLAKDLGNGTLPHLVFITPDLCNDMHNCAISAGDRWLSQEVPKILDSPAFGTNSLLVVTFDEGTSSDNSVATIFAGGLAKPGASSKKAYSHYALLHTIEALWGLKPLTANDRDAPVMRDLLQVAG